MRKRQNALPLKPVGGDPNTPRALLPKGSPEWCHRTLMRLCYALEQVRICEAHRDEVIEELKEQRAWERLPSPEAPYGSLEAMLEAELGLSKGGGKSR